MRASRKASAIGRRYIAVENALARAISAGQVRSYGLDEYADKKWLIELPDGTEKAYSLKEVEKFCADLAVSL